MLVLAYGHAKPGQVRPVSVTRLIYFLQSAIPNTYDAPKKVQSTQNAHAPSRPPVRPTVRLTTRPAPRRIENEAIKEEFIYSCL